MPHYYALMRAGYVLHSLECLECRVVGKCCSNVLRSLDAYAIRTKPVRTRAREKTDAAHARSSRYVIPFTQPSGRSYTPMKWSSRDPRSDSYPVHTALAQKESHHTCEAVFNRRCQCCLNMNVNTPRSCERARRPVACRMRV
jgi:hypothetical protein